MGKVSLNPKDFRRGGVGLEDCDVEITGASVMVWQLPPSSKTGEQTPPACYLELVCQPLLQGEPNGEPEEIQIRVGPIEKFQPSEDGEEGLGTELETRGNYAFSPTGAALDVNSAVGAFVQSLVDCGIDPGLFDDGDFRVLVGVKGFLTKIQKQGRDIGAYKQQVMTKVYNVDEVNRGRRKGAGTGARAGASAKTKAGSGAGAAAAGRKTKSVVADMKGLLSKILDGQDELTLTKLQTKFAVAAKREKLDDPEKVVAWVKDEGNLDELVEAAMEHGFEFDSDETVFVRA